MAKNDKPKNAEPKGEDVKKAEDAIFGAEPKKEEGADLGGATSTEKSTPKGKEETITLSKSQFESLFNRLSDLESAALANTKTPDNVFNPLAEVKSNHIVRVCYFGDELVVGYKPRMRPDGKEIHTYMKKDTTTGEMRTTVTLLLADGEPNADGTVNTREEEVDFVYFLQSAIPLEATMLERKDIGKLIEQELVNQMVWDGRKLVSNGMQVRTGAKEQKFIFTVEHKGKKYVLPQEVVNIK